MHSSKRIISFLLTLLLLALPPATLAQTPANDWQRVKAVAAGEELAVTLKDGKTVKGRLSNVTDTTLTLTRGKRDATDIAQAQIREVARLQPKSAKKAALIGAAIGAGIGAGIGGGIVSGGGESGENWPIPLLGLVGAGLGAVAGVLVGSGKKRVLIYESR